MTSDTSQPANAGQYGVGPWGMRISGLGIALPEKVLTNDDLTDLMDTSDEWIRERTGIHERRVGGTTSGLAIEAAQNAMGDAGIGPDDVDAVILATTTPDQAMPGTAPTVAHELGMQCAAFDIQAVCSGWVYGLVTANGLLSQGCNRVLLIGAETMDKITDYTDRGTGILFGNGAGAAVVERDESSKGELLAWDMGSNGSFAHILYADHGQDIKMDGREVFRQAVKVVQQSAEHTMQRAGLSADDIDLIIPHQANIRIVESAWKRLGLSLDKTEMILDRTGNTSSATIPLALHSAWEKGRIESGTTVMFVGFGAGMTWASAIVRWA